jgi:DNA-binding transcriptional MerR regulator
MYIYLGTVSFGRRSDDGKRRIGRMKKDFLRKKDIIDGLGIPKSTVSDWINDFSVYIPKLKQGQITYYKPEAMEVLLTVKELREQGYDKNQIGVLLGEKGFTINSDEIEGRIKTAVKTADRKSEQEGRDTYLTVMQTVGQLMEHIAKQDGRLSDLEKQLSDQGQVIKKQQEYIDERIKERDQKLMESIRQVQKVKEQIAAEKENKDRGFFSRIFKK